MHHILWRQTEGAIAVEGRDEIVKRQGYAKSISTRLSISNPRLKARAEKAQAQRPAQREVNFNAGYGFSMLFWCFGTIFGWEFHRAGCGERSTEMIVHRICSAKQGWSGQARKLTDGHA